MYFEDERGTVSNVRQAQTLNDKTKKQLPLIQQYKKYLINLQVI